MTALVALRDLIDVRVFYVPRCEAQKAFAQARLRIFVEPAVKECLRE